MFKQIYLFSIHMIIGNQSKLIASHTNSILQKQTQRNNLGRVQLKSRPVEMISTSLFPRQYKG
jgi:hypothetical protein